jgi:hypothetical protein
MAQFFEYQPLAEKESKPACKYKIIIPRQQNKYVQILAYYNREKYYANIFYNQSKESEKIFYFEGDSFDKAFIFRLK